MSTLQAANLTFESTQNTRIQYLGTNNYAFYASGTEAMRITATGNVGINNSAPTDVLSVNGSVQFTNSIASVLYVAANGNIGVNNTASLDELSVNGTLYLFGNSQLGANSTMGSAGVGSIPYANTKLRIAGDFNQDTLVNGIDNNTSAGNGSLTAARTQTGIRTQSNNYSQQLNVDGITRYGSDLYGLLNTINNSDSSGGDAYLNNMYGVSNTLRNWANGTSNSIVDTATGALSQIYTNKSGQITTAKGFVSIIAPAAANSTVSGNIGTAYAYSANIGLNTANASVGTGYLYYGVYPASANVTTKYGLYITNETTNYISGNVGIGTTTPAYSLHVVSGNSSIPAYAAIQNPTNYNAALELLDAGATGWSVGTYNTQFYFYNTTNRMTIDANGNTYFQGALVNAPSATVNALSYTSGANLTANSTNIVWTGNTTTSPTITLANTGAFSIGNSSTTQTTGSIVVANSAGNVQITAGTTSILASGLVNASAFTTTGNANAANFYSSANAVFNSTNIAWTGNTTTSPTITLANTGAFSIGNSSTTQTTGSIVVANSAGNVQITAGTTSILATGLVNASAFTTTGNANAANFNSGANLTVNSTNIAWTGNTTTSPTITLANTGAFTIGNSTTTQTTSTISVANSTGNVQITAGATSILASGLVNASAFTTTGNANATNFNSGANLTANSTNIVWTGNTTTSPTITLANTGAFTIGNSSTTQTAGTLSVANSTGNVQITAGTTSILATGLVNASAFTTTGNANATNFNSGANLTVNSTNIAWTGNTTTSPSINLSNTGVLTIGNSSTTQTTSTISVANSTGNVQITPAGVTIRGNVNIATNAKTLSFTPLAGGSNVFFSQQNDDNFVFYSTNTLNQQRAVWSVFGNSATSNLQVSVPLQVTTNLTVSTNTLTLGTSSAAANGYSRLPNGLLMQWGNDSRIVNATTTNTSTFPVAFTTLYSVTAVSRDTGIVAANASITVTALGTTTFTWRNYGTGAAAASPIYYVAIGV